MKNYIKLPIDFANVKEEVLNRIQPILDVESISNTITGKDFLFLTGASAACEYLSPIMENQTFDIEAIARYRINDQMVQPYTLNMADVFIMPLYNADSCTITFYEPKDTVVSPYWPTWPVGLIPNHGFYELTDCLEIESFDFTEPLFVKRDSIWKIESSDKENPANILMLLSLTDNDSYFSE
jgi:hypothetical protein